MNTVLTTAFFVATSSLYAIACALYITFAVRGRDGVQVHAARVLGLGTAAHVASLVMDFLAHAPLSDIRQSLSVTALLVSVGQLVASRQPKLAVLGAFTMPIALLLYCGAGLGYAVDTVPPGVRSALLPVHVGVNVLGVVAFALAFAVAVAYLIEERLLRRKRIGGLFQRLPPLHVLDDLGFRLVAVGFALFTVGVVSGTFFVVRLDAGVSVSRALGVLAWLCFATTLLLRVAAGWRGRRAAYGTLIGFACAIAVLIGYVVRDAGGPT